MVKNAWNRKSHTTIKKQFLRHNNKTENAFSPTLPEKLFDRKKDHKMLQNTSANEVLM